MRSAGRSIAAVIAAAAALAACRPQPVPPDIAFAPYGSGYASKPDFNDVEYRFALSARDRMRITPQNLAQLDQEQIDQVYARLTAGPLPDGPFDGAVIVPRGSRAAAGPAEVVGGLDGMALRIKGLAVEEFARAFWKAKVFDREHRVALNRIDDLDALRKLGLVDGETAQTTIDGRRTWLAFPAKFYCGQSLLDARRESIVVDYFFADDLPGYREKPDFLAGRRGLRVRDEIRMVRPGFYLGRAYLDRVFALNFTLYNERIANAEGARFERTGDADEACWTGTQAHRASAAR
jgi:hypothetical protein